MADKRSSDTQPAEDRREHRRHPLRMTVYFKEKEAAAKAFRAYSLNLSLGGLCLKTQRDYPVGTALELTVQVEERRLDLKTVVSWARGGAIGVRFHGMSPEQRQALAELLDQSENVNLDDEGTDDRLDLDEV